MFQWRHTNRWIEYDIRTKKKTFLFQMKLNIKCRCQFGQTNHRWKRFCLLFPLKYLVEFRNLRWWIRLVNQIVNFSHKMRISIFFQSFFDQNRTHTERETDTFFWFNLTTVFIFFWSLRSFEFSNCKEATAGRCDTFSFLAFWTISSSIFFSLVLDVVYNNCSVWSGIIWTAKSGCWYRI